MKTCEKNFHFRKRSCRLCTTYVRRLQILARRSEELAQVMQIDLGELERILDAYKADGFAQSFTDNEGKKRYYLTGSGIIKVCALFT